MTNTEKLLQLIKENPELPIVPMVDSEIVCDDSCGWWIGRWGNAEVGHYYIGREYVHVKGKDDEEDVLNDLAGSEYGRDYEGRDIYDLSDKEWDELYDSIPWIKAIMVRITT